ncbi:hypothetical protein RRG08_009609 [Elysia crispata]|uniref:Uncharacterized protein n=1 Tax=Elysia crispata TaxID=231223 RepID=A0AAE0XTA0_9GAST|nr:hypothetical protein RRG08_009609 [Elysia crispata]
MRKSYEPNPHHSTFQLHFYFYPDRLESGAVVMFDALRLVSHPSSPALDLVTMVAVDTAMPNDSFEVEDMMEIHLIALLPWALSILRSKRKSYYRVS